jgi:alpha-galactosidase/6-phospho-beta-glucosidase family protein
MNVQAVHENPAFNERVNAAAQHPPVAPKKAMRLFGDAIFADEKHLMRKETAVTITDAMICDSSSTDLGNTENFGCIDRLWIFKM